MSVQDDIKSTVEGHKVVLYMKGSPMMPQCGFSATVVQIFKDLGVAIHTVNVLASQDVREGVKAFTQWPTIPQVFIDGKFVGGCDIVKDLASSGELVKLLDAAGVPRKSA
jgi:monothiol glutaredoxin